MTIRIHVRKHELGLVFRRGDFDRVLEPGAWLVPSRLTGVDTVQVVDRLKSEFRHSRFDALVLEPDLCERLHVLEIEDTQRALVWIDGRLAHILGPGRHAFWREPHRIEIETFDVTSPRFEHDKLDAVLTHADAGRFLEIQRVDVNYRLLVFVDGELFDSVGAGVHAFWQWAGRVTFRAIDLREEVLDVAGQEIMTADKVTLRLNLVVTFRVDDPLKAVTVVSDHKQALYREAQLALRSAVGTRTIDALLTSKDAIGSEVREAVTSRAAEFGVRLGSIGVKDVILPGDMKDILNQVIEARKQAEANLIRRQEETAAARSQSNTARLLQNNSVLLRMKELEALQEILAGTKATFVFGSGDLTDQIRGLVGGLEA